MKKPKTDKMTPFYSSWREEALKQGDPPATVESGFDLIGLFFLDLPGCGLGGEQLILMPVGLKGKQLLSDAGYSADKNKDKLGLDKILEAHMIHEDSWDLSLHLGAESSPSIRCL